MSQGFAIDGIAGLALICLPILLLIAVVVWAVRQHRKPTGKNGKLEAGAHATSSVPATAVPPQQQRAAVPARSAKSLAAAIAKAERGSDNTELASLYIKQAQAYLANGETEPAASRLRDAIRVAALNNLAAPHALARVELGDLYLSQGDPITACEQWQIARQLFHGLERPEDGDDVDSRMLKNGCPSDWVLTDF